MCIDRNIEIYIDTHTHICMHMYIHTIGYYSAKTGMKSCNLWQHAWTKKGIMLTGISQTEKDRYCDFNHI